MATEDTGRGGEGAFVAGDRAAVGPVLMAGPVANAIVAVIQDQYPTATVTDRGSYLRVLVPGRCRVGRAPVEARLRQPFRLPGDLERVMTSFRGRFEVTADEASWTALPTAIPPAASPAGAD